MNPSDQHFDVIVIGGGPAGLSAALVLGRCRRRVLVCDSRRYRNAATQAMHGYLTRDGMNPAEFLRIGRAELGRYDTVSIQFSEVVDTGRDGTGFVVHFSEGSSARCRKLILATGVVDELPHVAGAEELYGRKLHHCPYCDGWEYRDQPIAVYGRGDADGAGFALELTQWSRDLVLCTDGDNGISEVYKARLDRFGIPVHREPIERFQEHEDGSVQIFLKGGKVLNRRAIFFNTDRHQPADFAKRLGCSEFGPRGCELKETSGRTSIPGLYIIGDASRDTLQVVVAAGEGSQAAIAINVELLGDDGVLI